MQLRVKTDLAAGLMFLGFGALFGIGATRYSVGTLDQMGPGFLPLCVGVLLALFGGLLIVRSGLVGDSTVSMRVTPLVLISLAICVFAAIYLYVGLVPGIVILTVIAARAGSQFRFGTALATGIVLAALCAGVFIYGLGIPLPPWPTVRL